MEIWKKIEGFENYEISNKGRVKSLKFGRERFLKKAITNNYEIVTIFNNGIRTQRMVHQFVAMTFLNHKPNGMDLVVDHINGIRNDNRVENLQIITNRENINKKGNSIKINKRSELKKSIYPGVYWIERDKKWRSMIRLNGKLKHLGCFTKEIEAYNAYKKALEDGI